MEDHKTRIKQIHDRIKAGVSEKSPIPTSLIVKVCLVIASFLGFILYLIYG